MAQDKPNVLVIWGDDIGITNLSCYSDGLMGYRTPNIDRIAEEGMRFTDSYAEQSCTAGRSAFLTGQSVFRTGLSKVGVPAAPLGLRSQDPTIAELLKPLGYATGQFGKNHLGDRNEFLPTVHASTSSSATSITSTPRRTRNHRTTRRRRTSRTSATGSDPGGCCTAGRPTRRTRPRSPAGVAWAGSASRTPGR
jgi:arylsulfatase A-like enzyme